MNRKLTRKQIESFVVKAQQHDESSFTRLFDYFFDPLYGYIARRSTQEDTEDLMSETWLRVVENLPKYSAQPNASFKSWIFTIAHNKIIDYYRTYKKHLPLEDETSDDIPYFLYTPEDKAPTPDVSTNSKLDFEAVKHILQKLPHKQREVLELKYLEGFTNHEIANVLDTTDGNIRVLQLRALRVIRKKLDERK